MEYGFDYEHEEGEDCEGAFILHLYSTDHFKCRPYFFRISMGLQK